MGPGNESETVTVQKIMSTYERWLNNLVVHCDGNESDQIPLGDLRNLIQIIQLNKFKRLLRTP